MAMALLLAGVALAQPKGSSPPATDYAQFVRSARTYKAPKTICYASAKNEFTQVLAPEAFRKRLNNPGARQAAVTSQFIVTYTGFTADAQRAFQRAVDIWSTLIVSPVPIRIKAVWSRLDPGVLGSAGPSDVRVGSDGTQKAFGIYPIALAEKIARRPLNSPDSSDIDASFSSNVNWYYGLDAKTPAGQYDLVSVVLHEIGHGLGFIGYYGTVGTTASYQTPYPAVYDHFIEDSQGRKLVANGETYPLGSNALYRQLTGNNIFLNGPVMQRTVRQRAKLYAPSTFDRGSSIYHLDEGTYPARDTNSLMTPQIGAAEAIHSPGPLVLNFFSDIEWKTTSILHTPLDDNEDVRDVVFQARIVSDTTLTAGSVRLFYRKGAPTGTDTTYTAVTPTLVSGTTDTYAYTMPASVAQGDIYYYFRAQDASSRTFTNPGKRPDGSQVPFRVQFGPDQVPPTVRYNPGKNFIINPALTDSLVVRAYVTDDRSIGVGNARLEYQINGTAQPTVTLRFTQPVVNRQQYDSIYFGRVVFPANQLKAGDVITYRIVARDSSRARNQAVSPATGFYSLSVVAPQTTVDRYTTTFASTTVAGDFAGYRFGIATPSGFSDPALHSEHPYQNGSDYSYQSNAEYILLSPIRVKSNPDSASIRFNEIVLVEPGDPGSRFGDANFYDYVIVEGSVNYGRTWLPLLDGYDSRDQEDWLAAYNRTTSTNQTTGETNSTTVGTSALFKSREFFIPTTGYFRGGDQIMIRFRLFSDQLAHGWGWAVDNLQIQVPPPPPVLANEVGSEGSFNVYPNPVSTGQVRVEAVLPKAVAEAAITVSSATGRAVRQQTLKVGGMKISEPLDLTALPTGLYFLKLQAGETTLTQKVIIAK
ncbi:T9SS type A sorting domain-containing protein [Spirosoma rhododendri]|uniref:T9SS type A sorting domain-containing protein n=2 Tax=Spirosoma rhododendri TaxID=2728024 RepID=A0A7L5DZ42_9BACT|nr:T9SS type A sorting domain-containing protein [Spirosoma rhododendri]